MDPTILFTPPFISIDSQLRLIKVISNKIGVLSPSMDCQVTAELPALTYNLP